MSADDRALPSSTNDLDALIQAFRVLYAQHRAHSHIELRIRKTGKCADVEMLGVHPAISARLTPDEFFVSVDWRDQNWDLLLWDNVDAERDGSGWRCGLCRREGHKRLFPSLPALWEDHLFMPLLKWVNKRLWPSRFASLRGAEDGLTWVRLSVDRPTDMNAGDVLIEVHQPDAERSP